MATKNNSSIFLIAIVVAVTSGAIVSLQGFVNGSLTDASGSPLVATLVSYVGTIIALPLWALLTGKFPSLWRLLRDESQWWWYCIGFLGVPLVLATSWGVVLAGVAVASVASVAGQTITGLILDSRGLGIPRPIPLTPLRILAAVISLAGLSLALIGSNGIAPWLLLGVGVAIFLGGSGLAGLQAGMGFVTGRSNNALAAGLASALGGTVLVLMITLVSWLSGSLDSITLPADPLLYLGGPFGAIVVTAAAWCVRPLGTFRLSLSVVCGQMAAAMVLDAISGMPLPWTTIAACVGVAIGLLIAVFKPQQKRKTHV